MQQLSPLQLAAWLQDDARVKPAMLDVRELWEVERCQIADSLHVPMNLVANRLAELDKQTPTVVICHHGMRSMHVAAFLATSGFTTVYNLTGGLERWSREVDLAMPTY
jgi:rhodanese-related sulfurtransferase